MTVCPEPSVSPWVWVGVAAAILFMIGAAYYANGYYGDTEPLYEVEMADGTIYQCHEVKILTTTGVTTHLRNINGTTEDINVYTHLIVRNEKL